MNQIFPAPLRRGIFMQILIAFLLGLQAAWPQNTGKIQGRVSDAQTGEALPGANVQILRTTLGSSTNREGAFVITQLQPGNYNLRASFIGYELGRAAVHVGADSVAQVEFALKPSPVEMSQVVVTASRESEEIQTAVVSVSALTNQSAMRRNPLRLDATLESIPGVSLVGENVNVRNSTGYTRGLGSRVLVLLDGVPVLNSDFGNMNWDILPVTDFESIEVIKGPSSALYGSFALGGVINIITKPPTPQGKFGLRVSAGVYDKPYEQEWEWTDRTLNFNRTDLSYSRQVGNLGMRFSLGRHESTGDRENRHFQRWNATGKLTYNFGDRSELLLFGAYARDRRGEFVWSENGRPFLVPLAFLGYRLNLDAYTFFMQYRHSANDWLQFKFRGSYVRQLTGNQYRVEGDFEPAQGPGADLQVQLRLDDHVSFTTGLEYHYDYAEQRQIGQHYAYTISPYVQQIWQPNPTLRVTAGFRFDHYYLLPGPLVQVKVVYNPEKMRYETVTVVNPLPGGKEEQYLSPQIGASWQLSSSTVLHSALGRGIRIPVLGERFLQFDQPIPFRPNPFIRTERSFAYELGVRQRFGNHVNLEVVGFYNDYDDLIEPVFVASATSFYATLVNIVEAHIPGVEVAGKFRFWDNRLGFDASATWTDPRITQAGEAGDIPITFQDDDLLTYRPRFIAYVTPSLTLGALTLEADYSYATKVEVQLFTTDQRVPKKQLDTRLLARWSNLTLQFSVRNLLQYYYTQVERNFNEVRSFSTGLMWEY